MFGLPYFGYSNVAESQGAALVAPAPFWNSRCPVARPLTSFIHVPQLDPNPSPSPQIRVVCEDDSKSLLHQHTLDAQIDYQKQGPTIITWNYGDDDIALSFQEQETCERVWEVVRSVLPDELIHSDDDASGGSTPLRNGSRLPLPNLANLEDVKARIEQAQLQHKTSLCTWIKRDEWVE